MCGEHEAAERFQLALGLTPLFARLVAARGWRETEALVEFLYPRLEHTHSPWLLLGMDAAVRRTRAAIAAGEPIRILGDYDADGTLATVILRQALRSLGAEVSFALPQRLEEGYGLTPAAIERAAAGGVSLAITVDTGIREHAALARARELGLDVIVTDHHLPGEVLPPACAIVNPHQEGCRYPDKGLCGAGVAFKLAQALLEPPSPAGPGNGAWPPALRSYLKLVAMATVADAAPLVGENRVLARFGLEGLSDPVNPGLRALLALALPPVAAAPAPRAVSSRDVAFRIAPRLNAAGRMGGAEQVVELFFAPAAEAPLRAQALEHLNQQRQQLCAAIEAEIDLRLATEPAAGDVLLLAGEGWHRGVLGIVASRVLERTGKAAVIVSLGEHADGRRRAHGSGRAPEGLHLLARLETCRELFERFGGHAQAVGFTLPADRLPQLRDALCRAAAPESPAKPREADGFPLRLSEITPALARDLARLEPYGEANPEPLFLARGVRLAAPPQRLKERHLKLIVEQDGARHTALCWNLWRDGAYQRAPGRPDWDGLTPGASLNVLFRLESQTHPVYGFQQQLILKSFTLAAAAW